MHSAHYVVTLSTVLSIDLTTTPGRFLFSYLILSISLKGVKTMKRTWPTVVLVICIACALTIAGCSGGGGSAGDGMSYSGGSQGTAAVPQMSNVTNLNNPGEPVRQGDWCQISGSNFGTSQSGANSNGYVLFSFQNGTSGQADGYQQWTDTSITCRVPVSVKRSKSMRDAALTITIIPPDSSLSGNPTQVSYNPTPNPSPDTTPPSPSPTPTPTPTSTSTPSPTPTPTPTPTATSTPTPTPTNTGGGGGGGGGSAPTTGSIKVTVNDGTNPIVGATLKVSTIVDTFITVAPDGTCTISNLAPGTYTVTASKVGYTTEQSDDITVTASTIPATTTITLQSIPPASITAFTILGVDGTIGPNSIAVTVPYGTDLSSLTPTVTIAGTSVNPASGVAQDFTSPVTYTVTAADDTTREYTVTVTAALNSAKNITEFTILGVNGTIGANTVALTVPYGTDLTDLTPTITITGASVNPASGAAHDFTTPQTYTVTAADSTTKDYTVTVTAALNPAKDITGFTILGIDGTIGANTVALTVPYGTNLTNLAPTVTITGASVNPVSGDPHDFTSPVTYTVTAADSTTKDYTVTVTAALNPAKDITGFTILGIDGTIGANTVALTVPYGTDLTDLTPTITITGSSVNPISGVSHNFSTPQTYTVTAADSTTKDYTVTVTAALNPAKDITGFTILGIDGTIGANTVALTVPYGTDLTDLTPTITITGASVNPVSGVSHNFSTAQTYTVTAADSTTKDYTVTVTAALNPAKDITGFTILGIDGTIGANTVALTVPYGTDLTDLTPTITITGASVNPISGVSHNFSTPQTYTVTAADSTTKDYTVTVTAALNPAKDITGFTILGIDGTIGANTVALTVPYGTDLTDLTPTITITGASVNPISGVSHNFSTPQTYTVTAADSTTKDYTVTVTAALNPAKDITGFTILGIDGTIGANTVALTVPYGTDLTDLTPTITITGASVNPVSGVSHNFSTAQTYTVTAADSTTKDYTVTVTAALNPAKDIIGFTILGIDGTIGANTVALTVPYGTDLTDLTPTITITGASVNPASGVSHNFSTPQTYTVTAADSTTKDYTVTVTAALNPAKDITGFTILGINGTIDTNTVSLALPNGTNLSSLTPTITITGASVNPSSGVAQNFTSPVTYTVTAVDGTTKAYTVTAKVYALRDTGPAGGLICYVNANYAADGWCYLEAAPASTEGSTKPWGINGTSIPAAQGTAIGTGQANTTAIIAVQGAGTTYAAQLCDALTSGGYSDWFLPSQDELNAMYVNLKTAGVGGFGDVHYWSSSEYDAGDAWSQRFYEGAQNLLGKNLLLYVRAVRRF